MLTREENKHGRDGAAESQRGGCSERDGGLCLIYSGFTKAKRSYDLLPCVKAECAVAGSGRAGRAAGRRSHRGRCRAEGRVGGGEAGSQGADGGHGGRCCAAETGDGLRQLAGHLTEREREQQIESHGSRPSDL